jgi:predicted transcriptional regulator
MRDFVVEIDGRRFIDIMKVLPRKFENGKRVIYKNFPNGMIEIYIKKAPGRRGHDSKKFILYRFIELDNLFFEGLGLWEGEAGKSKGLYFGNSCPELLLHFLRFVEQKLGLAREKFKVTVNSPNLDEPEDLINRRWSKKLRIPFEKFTHVCYDSRINQEYAQVYISGIVLSELMKNLHEKFKSIILINKEYIVSYLRGVFAAEGSVILKPSGVIFKIDFSTIDMKWANFLSKSLLCLGIRAGVYVSGGRKFQIYGRKNLEKVKEFKLYDLHPDKKIKFENGISKYQRFVVPGHVMEKLILKQLLSGPKTYDEISFALKKGRSTIQSHYIPILEKKEFVKKVGKRRIAWLFGITEKGIDFLENLT